MNRAASIPALSLELYVPRNKSVEQFIDEWSEILVSPLINYVSVTRGTGGDYDEDKHISMLEQIANVRGKSTRTMSHVTLSHLGDSTFDRINHCTCNVLMLKGDDEPSEYSQGLGLKEVADVYKWFPKVDHTLFLTGYPLGKMNEQGNYDVFAAVHHSSKAKYSLAEKNVSPFYGVITQWSPRIEQQLEFLYRLKCLHRTSYGMLGYFPFKSGAQAIRVAERCGITLSAQDFQWLSTTETFDPVEKFKADLLQAKAVNAIYRVSESVEIYHPPIRDFQLFTMNDRELTRNLVTAYADFIKTHY